MEPKRRYFLFWNSRFALWANVGAKMHNGERRQAESTAIYYLVGIVPETFAFVQLSNPRIPTVGEWQDRIDMRDNPNSTSWDNASLAKFFQLL